MCVSMTWKSLYFQLVWRSVRDPTPGFSQITEADIDHAAGCSDILLTVWTIKAVHFTQSVNAAAFVLLNTLLCRGPVGRFAQSCFHRPPTLHLCYLLSLEELRLMSSKWNRFCHQRCTFPWSGPSDLWPKLSGLWAGGFIVGAVCISQLTHSFHTHTHTHP